MKNILRFLIIFKIKSPYYKYIMLYDYKIIVIIILFIIFIFLTSLEYFEDKNIGKVCLCTVGKQENNYIIEYIKHYKKYGIDKIFLYDNNDINGERFEDILSHYIRINFIEIINFRGIKQFQQKIYQICYKNYYKNYKWLIFYDLDEFIYLKNYSNIKNYLFQKKFRKCPSIYLNWVIHTDNNLITYDNRTLYQRFPKKIINKYCVGKTIIKGSIEGINIKSCHLLDKHIKRCNGYGNFIKLKSIYCRKPDFKNYYIDHYEFKSTEEFIKKVLRGDALFGKNNKYTKLKRYIIYNKINLKKKNFIITKIGINVSDIIKKKILKYLIKKK